MSDDWKPGDLALCIKRTHPAYPGEVATRLVVLRIYTVERVGRPRSRIGGERPLGLRECSPRQPNTGWPESMFRKIAPGTKIHGQEVERERFKQGNPWKERV